LLWSAGCPFNCDFCVDSTVPYIKFPEEQIVKDLLFLKRIDSKVIGVFYDPNFGVNIDGHLDIIESIGVRDNVMLGAEMNLSRMTYSRVVRMHNNNFRMLSPGIESWFAYDKKTGIRGSPNDKMLTVSEKLNMVNRYMPFMQINLVFGIDKGIEPFELTKKFVDLVPGVYPNFQIITSFGKSTPFKRGLINLPYNMLDCITASNVVTAYKPDEFYDLLADLISHSFTAKKTIKRMARADLRFKAFYAIRYFTSGRGSSKYYRKLAHNIRTKEDYNSFFNGRTEIYPKAFVNQLKSQLGPLYRYWVK